MTSSNHQNKQHALPSAFRFYKFITKTTLQRESLKIPYSFTKIHGDHVQNPLFLKPPDGKEWEIHWNKHEGDILFQKGWKEFSKYYSLAHAYMVLFEYDDKKETCHFLVHIFNKNKVEIKYPFHPTQDEQQHGLNQIPVEQLPCKKRRPKSPKSHPQPPKKLRTNPSVDVGRSSKLQNLPKYVQVKEEIDDTTECLKVDQEKEQLTARNFKSKTPSFEVVMKSTYVEQYLYVPSEFAVKYLNTKATDILLKVKDERTWLVRYNFNKFSVGWKTFASDNNLKVGDVCLFVLTKSQPLTFKVLIFHHWKEPQESSAQPDELDDHARIPNAEIKTSISSRGKKAAKRNSLQTSPCTFTNNDALEKAEKFTSTLENPHYILNLKTSNWEFYRPRVPKSFFDKNLCKPKQTVMLKFRKKLWPVKLLSYPNDSSSRLGGGWNLFKEERKLEAGDVCVFELINREDVVLDVHVFEGHS